MKNSAEAQFDYNDLMLRIGFIGTALILWQVALTLWLEGQPTVHPLSITLSFVAWAVGIVLLVIAFASYISPQMTRLALISFVLALLAHAYLQWLNYSPLTTYHTDNEMITEYAVQALERGENPYTWNFSDILRVFRDPGSSFTPFLDGAPQNRVTYPALPILTLLGFDRLGIGQVRIITPIFHILLLILLFRGAPPQFRIVCLLPLYLLKEFVSFSLGGIQDIIWSALLVGVILTWKRPFIRASLFGLACTFRQQPWFVVPFLLITMWNETGSTHERSRRILYFLTVSLIVFLVINLPFILWDPIAWALGTFEPAYAKFDVISTGLGILTQRGFAPFPRDFYTALQISTYLIMLIVHWRHPQAIRHAFWAFPAIFFWVYYRGLPNYWIYWIPPLLLACMRWAEDASPSLSRNVGRATSWHVTGGLATLILCGNLLWGFILLRLGSPIEIRYVLPLETIAYGQPLINRIRLVVTNKSNTMFFPRFSAQQDGSVQALPWLIESGPEGLDAGQTGNYVIQANGLPLRTIAVSKGGQIVVTDAGGNYWLRAVLNIPPDPSFSNPDLIANPSFSSWSESTNLPDSWVIDPPAGLNTTELAHVDGHSALILHADPALANITPQVIRLKQTITLPKRIALWVYPTESHSDLAQSAYGLEVNDGEHKLWILFGDSNQSGDLETNHKFVYLQSPLKIWSKQEIALWELYERFGWQLPSCTRRYWNGLQYFARQVQLSLLLVSSSPKRGMAIFGPLEQSQFTDPSTLLRDALAHSDLYCTNPEAAYRKQPMINSR